MERTVTIWPRGWSGSTPRWNGSAIASMGFAAVFGSSWRGAGVPKAIFST
jgi:hypothetical protein